MKLFAFVILAMLIPLRGEAQGIIILANNKELISREIKDYQAEVAMLWSQGLGFSAEEFKEKAKEPLKNALNRFMYSGTFCDLSVPTLLKEELTKSGLPTTDNDIDQYLVYLRATNIVDDIFYKLAKDSTAIVRIIETTQGFYSNEPINLNTNENKKVDLKQLYGNLKITPDEIKTCSLNALVNIARTIKSKNKNDRNKQVRKLNYLAYEKRLINLATLNKLEILREQKVLLWTVNMATYLDTLLKSKDKMTTEPEKEATSKFSSTFASRRYKLTQRDRLYALYNPTQIIILSEIIQKTAKRMDARQVNINFQLTDDPQGEIDTYVLSPMEKYRLAIRMLRKEMAETMRSENFAGIPVEYNDLVSAAYETGYIKSAELDHIVKFEEFWNPKQQKWRTYANFALSLVGTATFYLPPPWNVVGAVALVVIQAQTINKKKSGNAAENWNSVIQ